MPGLNDFHSYISSIRSDSTADAYLKGAVKLVSMMRERNITFSSAPRSLMMDFVQYQSELGLSPRSVKLMLSGANRFIGWVKDQGVDVPELASADAPKARTRRPEVITTEILEKYLEAVKDEDQPFKAILSVLPFTGLRVEEVCALRVDALRRHGDDVSFVFFGKGGKERLVPLSSEARSVLDEYAPYRMNIGSSDWLFPRPSDPSRYTTTASVRAKVRSIRGKCGIPWLTPHKLRHVFATLLSEAGVQIEVIKELLGHSSIKTTQIYVHSSPDAMRRAVNSLGG